MNDFDRFLDLQLRRMLDPVVTAPPPPRRSRLLRARQPILAVEASVAFVPEAKPAVEPVVVTIPVTSQQL